MTNIELIAESFPIPPGFDIENNYAHALAFARSVGLTVEEKPDDLHGSLLVVTNRRGQEFRTNIKTADAHCQKHRQAH